jgi:hypothetical protein
MSILASAACKMAKPNETEGLYISLAEFAWAETLSFDEQYLRAIYQQSKEIAQKMRENWSRDRT